MCASVTVDILFILFISPRVNTQNIVMGRTSRGHLYTSASSAVTSPVSRGLTSHVTWHAAWRAHGGLIRVVVHVLRWCSASQLISTSGTRFQFLNDRDDKWGNLGLKYWAPHESLICSQLGSSISTHSPTCITHGFYSFICLCVWFMVVSLPLPPISWKP